MKKRFTCGIVFCKFLSSFLGALHYNAPLKLQAMTPKLISLSSTTTLSLPTTIVHVAMRGWKYYVWCRREASFAQLTSSDTTRDEVLGSYLLVDPQTANLNIGR